MQLHLLGTAGYHPGPTRQTACLALPEVGVVLDAGTGLFRLKGLLATPTLDIFLTHAHLDHVVGLTYLLGMLHDRPLEAVRVHGDPAKLAAIERHLFAAELFPVPIPAQFCPLTGPVALPGGGVVRFFPLAHPGGSLGYRLDWPGHSLAYVTDTTARADADYVAQIRGVDLLVHECNFRDGQEQLAALTGHSCATPVAQVARAAGAKRLILTHFEPLATAADPIGLPAMRAIFPAVELGCDEQVVEF